jgi:Fur family ferric uptake transcriptional regulator
LTNNGVVIKNTISGTDYYEIPKNHHHHLICLRCKYIEMIEISDHLKKQEKQIAKQNKFTIINHSLEFYGYCHKCWLKTNFNKRSDN